MSEARYGSAAASHPSHGWVITGGSRNGGLLSSAESTRDGRTFRPFATIPLALSSHCLVSLEGADSNDFLLTGGWDGRHYNKETFIYKQGVWRQAQDMPTARSGLMCGAVRSRPGGSVTQVVAAGGWVDGGYRRSVEIYNLRRKAWTRGRDLPTTLSGAAVVPFESTFLIIGGGKKTYVYTDKVYKYTTEGNLQELPEKLSEAKAGVTAIIVPSSLFNVTLWSEQLK